MTVYYNAFISYRHMPADIRVAEEVQRQLERFVIPREIRKKYGIPKIERIFRDKDELPITSNLTADIEEALIHSDYLIVICSPHTAESRWIQREIQLFKEHHGSDRILTVLADGEPGEVIPETLRKVTRQKKDEHGNTIEVTEEIEPLSADFRLPFSKARRTELPRLAAVLIGCTYDELMRRRQQYLLRRWAAIGSVIGVLAVCGIAYLLWSRAEIQRNYLQAQENLRQSNINQSRYLSAQSLAAYENQDRILAVQLALAAMPQEGNERPLIAEAEYALSRTLGLYHAGGALDFSAVRLYETGGVVRNFLLSNDKTHLAAVDSFDTVTLWNVGDNTPIQEFHPSGSPYLYEGDEAGFVIASNGMISKISWEDGSVLWSESFPVYPHLLHTDPEHGYGSAFSRDTAAWFTIDGSQFTRVPIEYSLNEDGYLPEDAWFFPDEETGFLVFSTTDEDGTDREVTARYDFRTETIQPLEGTYHNIKKILHNRDGSWLFIDFENSLTSTSMTFQNVTVLYQMPVSVYCLSSDCKQTLWSKTLTFSQDGAVDYRLIDLENDSQALLATLADHQYVLDASNGRLIHEIQWPSSVASILTADEEIILSLLSDGKLSFGYNDGSSTDTTRTGVTDNIIKGLMIPRGDKDHASILTVRQNDSRIIQYDTLLTGSGYRKVYTSADHSFLSSTSSDRYLGFVENNSGEQMLNVLDLNTDEIIYSMSYSYNEIREFSFAGDSLVVIYRAPDTCPASRIFLPDGTREDIELPIDLTAMHRIDCGMDGNNLYWICTYYDDRGSECGVIDIESGESSHTKAEGLPEGVSLRFDFLNDSHRAVVTYMSYEDIGAYLSFLFDFDTGTAEELSTRLMESDVNAAGEGGRFALRSDEGIRVYSIDGTELHLFPCVIDEIVSLSFCDGDLYLLNKDGSIHRYNSDFELTARYAGSDDTRNLSAYSSFFWEFDEDGFLLYADGVFEMFELNAAKCRMSAENTLAYDPANNRILVLRGDTENKMEIGSFPLYSPREMTDAAKEMLGDTEMTDAQKNLYGLE